MSGFKEGDRVFRIKNGVGATVIKVKDDQIVVEEDGQDGRWYVESPGDYAQVPDLAALIGTHEPSVGLVWLTLDGRVDSIRFPWPGATPDAVLAAVTPLRPAARVRLEILEWL